MNRRSWKPSRRDLDQAIELFDQAKQQHQYYYCQVRAESIRRLQQQLKITLRQLPDPASCPHDVLDLVSSEDPTDGKPVFACTRCFAHGMGWDDAEGFLLGRLQELTREVRG